jgi:hypothetical protein
MPRCATTTAAAQVKVDRKSEPRTDAARISTAMGVGANVIVTPYVASEMS